MKKPLQFCDVQTRQVKRYSEVSKNEQMRDMMQTCINHPLKFRYVLMDSWFSSKENFGFILQKKKHFVAALKDNRLEALNREDQKKVFFLESVFWNYRIDKRCAAG